MWRVYDRCVRAALLGTALCACAAPRAPVAFDDDLAAPARSVERDYTLAWRGARIGDAIERETWRGDGVRLVRRERVRVTRGGAPAATDVEVAIDADRALVASRVEWRELRSDGAPGAARAVRGARGWRIEIAGEPVRTAPGAAVPEELVPLIVRRDGEFHGLVLLTGRGLALARADVTARGPGALRATIATDAGALAADVTVDAAGDPLAIVGSDGVVVRRASRVRARRRLRSARGRRRRGDRARPRAARGSRRADRDRARRRDARAAAGAARPAGRRRRRTLARRARPAPATDSVAALRAIAQDVFASERGDCTAHALAFVARARGAADRDARRHRLARRRRAAGPTSMGDCRARRRVDRDRPQLRRGARRAAPDRARRERRHRRRPRARRSRVRRHRGRGGDDARRLSRPSTYARRERGHLAPDHVHVHVSRARARIRGRARLGKRQRPAV